MASATPVPRDYRTVNGPSLSRATGIVLIAGAIVGLVGLFVRPMADDPGDLQGVLQLYAANADGFHLHALLTPIGWLLILAGVIGVCRSAPAGQSLRWADLTLYATAIFAVLGLIGPTLDGVLMPAVAQAGVDRPLAEAMYAYSEAMAGRFALVFALGILTLGLALRETGTHPNWLGWTGVVLGTAGLVVAVSWMATNVFPAPGSPVGVLFFAFVLAFPWYLIVGWYQVRPHAPRVASAMRGTST